ncbi:hypothetical protein B0H17DRAFT_1218008 [Mycena rosella]|uniref:DUF6533 domain-containing protein n=1 Tax=Mycena rosella TaxID=1033263 RepID=A0AAD7BT14_MYCRO|nr:hypothetical protein B0H17DRAFT_1218008 [Mycena rosella]
MSAEASVFATRYLSAVGVAVLLYDHVLTIGDEIAFIWLNSAAGLQYRIIFMVDRYLTEAVSLYAAYSKSFRPSPAPFLIRRFQCCRKFLWILALTTSIFTSLSNLILAMRVYTLWDRRRTIKWLLMCAFGVAFPASVVFSVLSAQEIQSSIAYSSFLRMCVIKEKPSALPVVLGIWVVFDFFIVILTIYNALEQPHQTQTDVMITLQHDGAKMLLWAMCSVVTSRMQLRVERLRFTRFGGDLLPINFLHMEVRT